MENSHLSRKYYCPITQMRKLKPEEITVYIDQTLGKERLKSDLGVSKTYYTGRYPKKVLVRAILRDQLGKFPQKLYVQFLVNIHFWTCGCVTLEPSQGFQTIRAGSSRRWTRDWARWYRGEKAPWESVRNHFKTIQITDNWLSSGKYPTSKSGCSSGSRACRSEPALENEVGHQVGNTIFGHKARCGYKVTQRDAFSCVGQNSCKGN